MSIVGYALLVTKVGQHDEDTSDAFAVLPKQRRTLTRVRVGFHAAELGVIGSQHDCVQTHARDELHQVGTRLGHQFVREEVAIADDNAEQHAGRFYGRGGGRNRVKVGLQGGFLDYSSQNMSVLPCVIL